MDQKIKMGLGVSKKSYKNLPGQPRILCRTHGKDDISSFWAIISSLLLCALGLAYQGLELPGMDSNICIERNDNAYSDDIDTWGGNTGFLHSTCYDTVTIWIQ